jgi:iron(II)-dependent oxidoreductase
MPKTKFPDHDSLCAMLDAARKRTLAFAGTVGAEWWLGPYLKIVNPPLWEIGHVGWFEEFWCLRRSATGEVGPSIITNADALYNSALVPHQQRWHLPLPDPDKTMHYLRQVRDAVLFRLEREGANAHLRYFVQLAAYHEYMHDEAFHYTLQTHGHVSPVGACHFRVSEAFVPGDVTIYGGTFALGARPDEGFAFDNEKWAHEVEVRPYQMSRTAVSNGEFAAFVDAGGYHRQELWCEQGWDWRKASDANAPLYWQKTCAGWQVKQFDRWVALDPRAAMIHVNWFEASAYCRWARRRLPTEAEWEFAAATTPDGLERKRRYPWGDEAPSPAHANLFGCAGRTIDVHALPDGDSGWGVRQMFGNAWEWTADWFLPYPGFVRDPYKEYSEPWFGNHKVLRGGCYATSPQLLRNTWRNFYTPDRRDVLAGFRTCALD